MDCGFESCDQQIGIFSVSASASIAAGCVRIGSVRDGPDYALLTGEKIPPVTPNILDVRIVRQEVTADFPPPNPTPSN
jgi:hypothetical protein